MSTLKLVKRQAVQHKKFQFWMPYFSNFEL